MGKTVTGRFPGMRRDHKWTVLQLSNQIAIIRSKNRIAAIHLKSGMTRLSKPISKDISIAHITEAAGGREVLCPVGIIKQIKELL